jgi:hypothetical protein
MALTGCGGGGDGGSASTSGTGGTGGTGSPPPVSSPGPGTPGTPANNPPTISASPATSATIGAAYELAPTAQDADGDTLAFSITNRPAWATFSTATGRLSGTPQAEGATSNIVISVSDGKNTVALPAFTITVAAAATGDPTPTPVSGKAVALSWEVPTRTIDGETLGDLTGYRIHYGRSANAMTQSIEIQSAGANTYTVQVPKNGTYYFAVRAITADGNVSALSNVIARSIS